MANAIKQTNSNTSKTVIVLPCSDERTLCVQLTGAVTREEYDASFYNVLQKFVENGINFGLLIHYKDYLGWNTDAAARSFESIIDHGKFARRMAYVNAPDSKVQAMKIAKPLLGGKTRFFNEHELQEAIDWVKAD